MRISKNIGKQFNRLTIVSTCKEDNVYCYDCKCVCGNTIKRSQSDIISGRIKSCGCLAKEKGKVKLEKGESGFNELFRSYKYNAKRRGKEFCLTKEQFKILSKSQCYYCGDDPTQTMSKDTYGEYVYNGVDRKDSSLGYTVDNCVPCCGKCNHIKSGMGYEEFIYWLRKVAKKWV